MAGFSGGSGEGSSDEGGYGTPSGNSPDSSEGSGQAGRDSGYGNPVATYTAPSAPMDTSFTGVPASVNQGTQDYSGLGLIEGYQIYTMPVSYETYGLPAFSSQPMADLSQTPVSVNSSFPGGITENTLDMYNRLTSLGVTPAGAAGFVGAMTGESGMGLDPTAVNPVTGAYGIAQDLGSRLVGLQSQPNYQSYSVQADYVVSELSSTESATFSRLMGATTVDQGVQAGLAFERPSAREIASSLPARTANANTIMGYVTSPAFNATGDVQGAAQGAVQAPSFADPGAVLGASVETTPGWSIHMPWDGTVAASPQPVAPQQAVVQPSTAMPHGIPGGMDMGQAVPADASVFGLITPSTAASAIKTMQQVAGSVSSPASIVRGMMPGMPGVPGSYRPASTKQSGPVNVPPPMAPVLPDTSTVAAPIVYSMPPPQALAHNPMTAMLSLMSAMKSRFGATQ